MNKGRSKRETIKLEISDLRRMIKECFWDYNISENDILDILKSNDIRKKAFLFEKILLNSTRLFHDLKIFNKSDLKLLLDEYKLPNFNRDFAFRRKNLVEVYFFNKRDNFDGEFKKIVGKIEKKAHKKIFTFTIQDLTPHFYFYLAQFSTFKDFILLNSLSLFVTNIKSLLNAQAAINRSSGPVIFPSFSS